MNKRKGDWMLTYTGRKFFPMDPRPEDVCIADIAHALSLVCRFGGQLKEHYSVACHSLNVWWAIPASLGPKVQLCALLHDAPEAYIGDMIAPLKRHIPQFQKVEELVWGAIAGRYFGDQSLQLPKEVKLADKQVLLGERDKFMSKDHGIWLEDIDGIQPAEIKFSQPSEMAEMFFVRAFRECVEALNSVSEHKAPLD